MGEKSLKARIYFSPLGKLIHYATKLRSALGTHCIVYGYRCKKTGKFLKRTRVASTAIITEPENLTIGDNVWINHYSRIDASGGVTIGEGCQIGFGSMILSHSSHVAIRLLGLNYMDSDANDRPGYVHRHTTIGEYTFVGGGSCILPGVTVGKGCVIGVNSVVTKDVPDYAVVVGSPARIIGSTKNQDAPFLNDEQIKESYYDKESMQTSDNKGITPPHI